MSLHYRKGIVELLFNELHIWTLAANLECTFIICKFPQREKLPVGSIVKEKLTK
jgi:hypothetical protein